jgi:hypothetical protein
MLQLSPAGQNGIDFEPMMANFSDLHFPALMGNRTQW